MINVPLSVVENECKKIASAVSKLITLVTNRDGSPRHKNLDDIADDAWKIGTNKYISASIFKCAGV